MLIGPIGIPGDGGGATISAGVVEAAVNDYLTTNPPSVANGSVTNTKLATVPAGTIKGSLLASTAITDLTPAQARSVLDVPQTTRAIATQHSLTGGGSLAADRTLSLVGDVASPGVNKVYGTDAAGTRGWKDDPAGGVSASRAINTTASITGGGTLAADRTLSLVNDISSPGANRVYGTDSSGVKGWKDDPAGGGVATTRAINTTSSLTGGGNLSADRTLSLVNDTASPGTSKLYGTDASGVRGWFDQPAGALNALTTTGTGQIAGLTQKATPVAADLLLIEDSAASNAKRRIRLDSLPTGGLSAQAQGTITGRNAGVGSGLPGELTPAQARAIVAPEQTVAPRITSRRGNTIASSAITQWGRDYVSPRDFNGWDESGANDVTAALQAAIKEAVWNSSAGRPIRTPVIIPASADVYKVGALDLSYTALGAGLSGGATTKDARFIHIEGESPAVRIGWTHDTGPGMTLQAGYGKLKNIRFQNADSSARKALLPTAWYDLSDPTELGNTTTVTFDATRPGLVWQNAEIATQNDVGTDYFWEVENVDVLGQMGHGIILDRPELFRMNGVQCFRNAGHGLIMVGMTRATTPSHIGISNLLQGCRFQENVGNGIVIAYTSEVTLNNIQCLSNRGVFHTGGTDPLFPMDSTPWFPTIRSQILMRVARSIKLINPDLECQRYSFLGVSPTANTIVGIRGASSVGVQIELGAYNTVRYAIDMDGCRSVSITKPRANNASGSFVSGNAPFSMKAIVRTRASNSEIDVDISALDTNVERHIEYVDAGAEKSIVRGVIQQRTVSLNGSRPTRLIGSGVGAAASQSADWLPGDTWFRTDTGLTESCTIPGSTTTALSGITATGTAGDIWVQVSGTTNVARNTWVTIAGNSARYEVDEVKSSVTAGTASGTSGAATAELTLTQVVEVGQRITISGTTYRVTSIPSTGLLSGTYGVSPVLAGTVAAGTSVTRPAHIRLGTALPTGFSPSAAAVSLAAPEFSILSSEEVDLGANQYGASNATDTALEARTDRRTWSFTAPITANGTYPITLWGDIPVTNNEISAATFGGSCSIKIQKNGVDINGFGTAKALTTTTVNTASTEAFTEGQKITLVVSAATSLTGIYVTGKAVRTGD